MIIWLFSVFFVFRSVRICYTEYSDIWGNVRRMIHDPDHSG